jgi:hypothetical protein
MRKYSRQVRLAAIGEAGQKKITLAEAIVSRDFAGTIAARYLRGAGVSRVCEGDVESDARFDELDPAAREVAIGAHAAASAIMRIVKA